MEVSMKPHRKIKTVFEGMKTPLLECRWNPDTRLVEYMVDDVWGFYLHADGARSRMVEDICGTTKQDYESYTVYEFSRDNERSLGSGDLDAALAILARSLSNNLVSETLAAVDAMKEARS
jgi:hypothetical protein